MYQRAFENQKTTFEARKILKGLCSPAMTRRHAFQVNFRTFVEGVVRDQRWIGHQTRSGPGRSNANVNQTNTSHRICGGCWMAFHCANTSLMAVSRRFTSLHSVYIELINI